MISETKLDNSFPDGQFWIEGYDAPFRFDRNKYGGGIILVRLGGYRSSHRSCSVRKGVLKNFAKFTGKHLCQSLFFNKVAGLRPVTLLKRRPWHRCFPVNFAKFLRIPFLQNTS